MELGWKIPNGVWEFARPYDGGLPLIAGTGGGREVSGQVRELLDGIGELSEREIRSSILRGPLAISIRGRRIKL